MTWTPTFKWLPQSIRENEKVRFFPHIEPATSEEPAIISYLWDFGDGATSSDWCAVHTYSGATPYSFDVTLTVSDTTTPTPGSWSITVPKAVTQNPDNVIPIPQSRGYGDVGIVLQRLVDGWEPEWLVVTRYKNKMTNLKLLSPVTTTYMDKSGLFTCKILNEGDADSSDLAFITEGTYVFVIMGNSLTFSGVIRRVSQNKQSGYSSTNLLKLWDIECDSDYLKFKEFAARNDTFTPNGEPLIKSSGRVMRDIIEPEYWGTIFDYGYDILYQLNTGQSLNESVGSSYEHMQKLYGLTNYDLNILYDFVLFDYTDYTGYQITIPGYEGSDLLFPDGIAIFLTDDPASDTGYEGEPG